MTTTTLECARWATVDSAVMVGRGLRHAARSLDALITAVLLPVLILVMFVVVFGGAVATSGPYIDYVVPGIILLCAGYGSALTAVDVNLDKTRGVIDRFRSLPILGSAVLWGHVLASVARNVVSTVLVLGVGLLLGFRPVAGAAQWLATLGVLLLYMVAISWLAAAFGLLTKSAEAAGSFSFAVLFLPYISSAFVPVETMPAWIQGFASHQPTTPIIETLRGLMTGTPVGDHAGAALAWCLALALVGVLAAGALWRRATR